MNLHQHTELFKQAVRATAQQKGLLDIYIEKDYWVTMALHAIFNNKVGRETIFKGGTALSKCYGLIDRFSEDIDLVVLRKEKETNNQLTKKLKQITEVVNGVIPEVTIEEVTHKRGMNRKTAHSYTKEFEGNYGQVRDVIVLEATWLGYFEPYVSRNVSSYIYDMMVSQNQEELAKEYGLQPFEVTVLDIKRTLCEKIMSLVRFSHSNQAIEDLNQKIRHIYDIHQLLKQKEVIDFFNTEAFDKMLLKVANDDVVSFKNNNAWLKFHPQQALLFSQPEKTWSQLKDTYQNRFKNLVFGEFPGESEIFETVNQVSGRLKSIIWTITLSPN